jgi:hypothetical protein
MMQVRRWDGKMLFVVGVFGLAVLLFMSCLSCGDARDQPQTSIGSIGEFQDTASRWSGTFRLTEMVQRQDSVIMRTDPKDRNYEERQWEEREKEKQSWDMLKNMIIDGRQPPRRFSDPRANERPQ